MYKDLAISEMQISKIPASITLAQGMFESGYGGSRLAVKANNHFGIKCGGDWRGATISHDDDAKGECFRKYRTVEESYSDHSKFLTGRDRYASLFDLNVTDYKGWAKGLKSAGYATNPNYANMLIDIIERYNLQKFDSGKVEDFVAKNDKEKQSKFGENNSVPYIVATNGDSWETLSEKADKSIKTLLRYNDLPAEIPVIEGMWVYIKPKKSSNKTEGLYTAQRNDSSHSLSQRFGIKLSSLRRLNPTLKKREVTTGDLIRFN